MKINGPTLRALREASGLSQVALSAATGVSQGRVSEIEAGKNGEPLDVRPATAKAIAAALHVPLVAITVPAVQESAS